MRRTRRRWLTRELAASVLSAAACSTAADPPPPGPGPAASPSSASDAGPPIGLDLRPVAPACLAPSSLQLGKPLAADGLPKMDFVTESRDFLQQPIEVEARRGHTYVAEQRGRLRRFEREGGMPVILDLAAKVTTGYDQGLLGFALHPAFPDTPYVYVSYTAPPGALANAQFESVIARYTSNDGGLSFDPASEKRILAWPHPSGSVNHNNGCLAFGPDRRLYIGSGDAAVATELTYQTSQKTEHLLGKILRIDVDAKDPYAIPPDNPFANGGGRPEIYAYGLRNPWRFSFDPVSGRLWAGDVGHSSWEEIDEIVPGGNYGWGNREGFTCFALGATCDGDYVEPLAAHSHTEAFAIVGGVFYRGKGIPALAGHYVYGDEQTSNFWAMPIDGEKVPVRIDGERRAKPASIRLDENGEILVVSYSGSILRMVAVDASETLSLRRTGCVDSADATLPNPGLFYYDVREPEPVAEGTSVVRRLAIPEAAPIVERGDGRLELPPRSVAMKTLSAEGRAVETQLLLRYGDGSWRADTYVWDLLGTDATLATMPTDVRLPSGRIHTVDPASCARCHSAVAGMSVGLTTKQLDRSDVDYGGGRLGNPLATLRRLGMIAPAP